MNQLRQRLNTELLTSKYNLKIELNYNLLGFSKYYHDLPRGKSL